MLDRDVENGMTVCAENPQFIRTCPHCGSEWEMVFDRMPLGIATHYVSKSRLIKRYPIMDDCCPDCAVNGSSLDDKAQFVQDRDLILEFFCFLFGTIDLSSHKNTVIFDFWHLIVRHRPDMLDAWLRQFIEDEHEDDFINWRYGE